MPASSSRASREACPRERCGTSPSTAVPVRHVQSARGLMKCSSPMKNGEGICSRLRCTGVCGWRSGGAVRGRGKSGARIPCRPGRGRGLPSHEDALGSSRLRRRPRPGTAPGCGLNGRGGPATIVAAVRGVPRGSGLQIPAGGGGRERKGKGRWERRPRGRGGGVPSVAGCGRSPRRR